MQYIAASTNFLPQSNFLCGFHFKLHSKDQISSIMFWKILWNSAKILWEQSLAYSFMYCVCLSSHYSNGWSSQRLNGPERLNHLLSGLSQKKFSNLIHQQGLIKVSLWQKKKVTHPPHSLYMRDGSSYLLITVHSTITIFLE